MLLDSTFAFIRGSALLFLHEVDIGVVDVGNPDDEVRAIAIEVTAAGLAGADGVYSKTLSIKPSRIDCGDIVRSEFRAVQLKVIEQAGKLKPSTLPRTKKNCIFVNDAIFIGDERFIWRTTKPDSRNPICCCANCNCRLAWCNLPCSSKTAAACTALT